MAFHNCEMPEHSDNKPPPQAVHEQDITHSLDVGIERQLSNQVNGPPNGSGTYT
jgi:hypothetical protein